MKPNLKYALLGATSALAIAVATPSVVFAQSQSSATMQSGDKNSSSTMQNDMSSMIEKLKQARKDLRGASKRQVSGLAKNVTEDLKRIRSELQGASTGLGKSRTQQLEKDVDKAISAFEKPRSSSRKLARSLTPVISGLQKVADNNSGTMGSKSAALSNGNRSSDGAASDSNSQDGANIKVKQQSPKIQVSQPAPKVVVKQPPPKVVITQAKPEVVIDQAKPDVKVTTAEPNVTVKQSGEPKVTVQQDGKAQVDTKQSASNNSEQNQDKQAAADNRPDQTSKQTMASNDRDENSKRPMASNNQDGSSNQSMADGNRQAMNGNRTPGATTRYGANPSDNRAAVDPAVERVRQMGRTLVGKELYGSNNQSIAEIENVVVKDGKVSSVLVDVGGFLGLGERRVSIPLDRLRFENGRLTTTMTEKEVQNLKPYNK